MFPQECNRTLESRRRLNWKAAISSIGKTPSAQSLPKGEIFYLHFILNCFDMIYISSSLGPPAARHWNAAVRRGLHLSSGGSCYHLHEVTDFSIFIFILCFHFVLFLSA